MLDNLLHDLETQARFSDMSMKFVLPPAVSFEMLRVCSSGALCSVLLPMYQVKLLGPGCTLFL